MNVPDFIEQVRDRSDELYTREQARDSDTEVVLVTPDGERRRVLSVEIGADENGSSVLVVNGL